MKTLVIWTTFVLLVLCELGWFVWPRVGSVGRDDYRFAERSHAFTAYADNKSTNNWNTVEKELELAMAHDSNMHLAKLSVLIALDIPIFSLS